MSCDLRYLLCEKIIEKTGEEQKTIKEKEDLEDNSLITDQTE